MPESYSQKKERQKRFREESSSEKPISLMAPSYSGIKDNKRIAMKEAGIHPMLEAAQQYQSSFAKGILSTYEAPGKAIAWGLEKAGIEAPLQIGPFTIGSREAAAPVREYLTQQGTITEEEPRTFLGRVGQRAGEVSEAVGEFGALLATGGATTPAVVARSGFWPILKNIVLQPYRANRAAALIRDLNMGSSAGTFMSVIEQLYPEGTPGRGAAVAGAGMLGAPVPGAIRRGLGAIGRRAVTTTIAEDIPGLEGAREAAQAKYAEDALEAAAKRFQAAGTREPGATLERIEAYKEMRPRHPGIELNIAQVTGEKGYRTLLSDTARHNTKYAGQLEQMHLKTERNLISELERTAPTQGADAETVSKLVTDYRTSELSALDAYVNMAKTKATEAIRVAGADASLSNAQVRFAEMVTNEVLPSIRARSEELYSNIPEILVKTAPLKMAISRELQKMPAIRKAETPIPKLVQRVLKWPENMSFSEFKALRELLNWRMYEAGGIASPNKSVERLLSDLKHATDDVLDSMMLNHRNAIVASRYKLATDYYHDAMQRLKSSLPGGRVTGLGKGTPIPGSSALEQYAHLGRHSREDAIEWQNLIQWMRTAKVPAGPKGELRSLSAEADEAERLMENYLISSAFRSSGIAEGKTSGIAERLARWNSAHEEILQHFPSTRTKLSNTQRAVRLFEERQIAREANIKEFQKSVASDFLQHDIDTAIDAALHPRAGSGKTPGQAIAELLRSAGNHPDARDGIKRAIWDRMMKDAFRERISDAGDITGALPEEIVPANLIRFLRNNEKVLASQWPKRHIDMIEEIGRLATLNKSIQIGSTSRPRLEMLGQAKATPLTFYRDWVTRVHGFSIGGTPNAIKYAGRFLTYLFEQFPDEYVAAHIEQAGIDMRHAELLLRKVTRSEAEKIVSTFRPAPFVIGLEARQKERGQR